MNKITRKKPNYTKLFINAYANKLYGIIYNKKTYEIIFGGRSNGKQYVLNEMKKYNKGGDR